MNSEFHLCFVWSNTDGNMFAEKDAIFTIDKFILSSAQNHGSFRFLFSHSKGQRREEIQGWIYNS
jgi:hypothetical protein